MSDLVGPLFIRQAIHQEEQIIYHTPHRQVVANHYEAREHLSAAQTLPGEVGHRPHVVREHDPTIARGPREDRGIVGPAQTNVLDTHDI